MNLFFHTLDVGNGPGDAPRENGLSFFKEDTFRHTTHGRIQFMENQNRYEQVPVFDALQMDDDPVHY